MGYHHWGKPLAQELLCPQEQQLCSGTAAVPNRSPCLPAFAALSDFPSVAHRARTFSHITCFMKVGVTPGWDGRQDTGFEKVGGNNQSLLHWAAFDSVSSQPREMQLRHLSQGIAQDWDSRQIWYQHLSNCFTKYKRKDQYQTHSTKPALP